MRQHWATGPPLCSVGLGPTPSGPQGVVEAAEEKGVCQVRKKGSWADNRYTSHSSASLTWEWWAMPGSECPPRSSPTLLGVTVLRKAVFLGLPWCLCALHALVLWTEGGETGAVSACWAGSGSCVTPPQSLPADLLTCPGVRCHLHFSAPFSMTLQGRLPLNDLLAFLYTLLLFPEHMLSSSPVNPSLLQSLLSQAALLALPDQTFLFFL